MVETKRLIIQGEEGDPKWGMYKKGKIHGFQKWETSSAKAPNPEVAHEHPCSVQAVGSTRWPPEFPKWCRVYKK
jgi:hypothetical protein